MGYKYYQSQTRGSKELSKKASLFSVMSHTLARLPYEPLHNLKNYGRNSGVGVSSVLADWLLWAILGEL